MVTPVVQGPRSCEFVKLARCTGCADGSRVCILAEVASY